MKLVLDEVTMKTSSEITNGNRFTQQLQCLVCGAILDPATIVCPVCSSSHEHFVTIEVPIVDEINTNPTRIVIIGGGVAAYTAAATARSLNSECKITVYSQETYLPYNRPMLTKQLLTLSDPNKILIKPAIWYTQQQITIKLDSEIISIDHKQRRLHTNHQEVVPYDKLIIATGADSSVPPIEGSNNDCVTVIRSVDDVLKIQNLTKKVNRLCVIGGGVLGLEAAWEFRKAGLEVTILEVAPKIMSRQLDDVTADRLAVLVRASGCQVLLGVKINKIEDNGSVWLADGSKIDSQLVVISAGIKANIKLAQSINMDLGRAIKVNKYCETSIKDIYACGDCAEYEGVNYALWSQAVMMGKVAASNALGLVMEYVNYVPSLSFFGMNIKLFAIGDVGKDESKEYQLITDGDVGRYYFYANQLCGAILFGDTAKMGQLVRMFEQKVSVLEFEDSMRLT
jgi:NADH oxidase (H2O-forming)